MKKLIYLLAFMPLISMAQAPTFQQEFAGGAAYNQGQIVQLIGAIPADKFSWKSSDDVRSIAEVIAHIASANYMFADFLGAKLPDGIDYQSFEKTLTTKEDLLKAINESFAFVTTTANTIKKDDLVTQIDLPFGKYTKRAVLSITNSHCSEHKGQLIAYARFIGVTPPWSMGGKE